MYIHMYRIYLVVYIYYCISVINTNNLDYKIINIFFSPSLVEFSILSILIYILLWTNEIFLHLPI